MFSVHGHITVLAADGDRAAVSTRIKPGCGRVIVWTAPGKRSIRVKPGTLGCAVGGGRMAVETGGTVTIRAASGAKVATVPDPVGSARAAALSKTRLAIERTLTLDVYDPATAAAEESLPLGAAASLRLADVSSRLALLRGAHRLLLVRLSDGKRISFPLRSGAAAPLVGGRLTEAGLFYAYNTQSVSLPGRIVFEPMGKLLARF